MKMKNEKNDIRNQDVFAETCASIISGAISFFVLLLVLVFPLIYHQSYVDILETKYKCYWGIVVGMLTVCLVLALIMLVIDMMEHKGDHVKKFFMSLHPANWKHTFCMADAAVLVFLLILVISTLQSDYLYESFWGNEGRYTGLFLLSLYVGAYFVISRFWNLKGWLLETFLCSGMLMCIIGITDYFQMDVLGFRGEGGIHIAQSAQFTSTVGNINTYTAYVALLMAFSSVLFITARSGFKMIWYYICMVISFFAIIMGCSDNAYLALGALFGILPLIVFKTRRGIRRYLTMLATFFTVVQIIDWINQRYTDTVIGLDSLFQIIVTFGGLLFVVAGLWLLAAGVCYYDKVNKADESKTSTIYVKLWIVLVAAVVIVVIYAVIDANFLGNGDRYGSLGSYLVFNDSWGTNRGYIWRKAIELYQDFTPMHKLFGYGPDTFGILTTNEIFVEMLNATSQSFDNVHNEYLQYLITIGPIGLTAYIVFLISAMIRMLTNTSKNPYIIGCCFAVICYSIQALVNLNLPIATPVMWLLLSIGMAASRRETN
ncbi:MAG: O-antigen ligase family protein [Lachnospiraceae bacterium]